MSLMKISGFAIAILIIPILFTFVYVHTSIFSTLFNIKKDVHVQLSLHYSKKWSSSSFIQNLNVSIFCRTYTTIQL